MTRLYLDIKAISLETDVSHGMVGILGIPIILKLNESVTGGRECQIITHANQDYQD